MKCGLYELCTAAFETACKEGKVECTFKQCSIFFLTLLNLMSQLACCISFSKLAKTYKKKISTFAYVIEEIIQLSVCLQLKC